jgi:NADH-quinone oxidoreductase subunit M
MTASLLLIVGFSVKVPLWPFISWLIKAHVEASTEFSIYLSGFLVKFGVWCLIRTLDTCYTDFGNLLILALAMVGLIEGVVRM